MIQLYLDFLFRKIRKSFFSNSSVLTSFTDLVEIFLIQIFLASKGIKQKLLKSSKIIAFTCAKISLSALLFEFLDSKILFKYSELNDSNSSSLKILSSSVIISSIESSSSSIFLLSFMFFKTLEETISKYFLFDLTYIYLFKSL